MQPYFVTLEKLIKEYKLEILTLPKEADEIRVTSWDVNRPGLQLMGFLDFFDPDRIQILGKTEFSYLQRYSHEERMEAFEKFFQLHPVAVVITRDLEVEPRVIELAVENEVALLRTHENTSVFSAALVATLNVDLAPRVTRHGVLVEVYGEGILLLGESGVGKSETAIELVKRGHRLIADDAVEIRRVSAKTLVGSSPDNIRHFLELRGVGIINVRRIFGIGAVKPTEKIDMIIQLEQWDSEKMYDRMGLESEYTDILGIKVPSLVIPVKPGRNLAVIIEVASMNNRQKKLGYNAAEDLLERLGMVNDLAAPSAPDHGPDQHDWEDY